jgi:hypothetical protein
MKPNIVVMGVGHSGTTILTRMLGAAGWDVGDADDEYCESVKARELNEQALCVGAMTDTATTFVRSLKQPWVLKDPRFCETLHLWHGAFDEAKPLLIWLTRNRSALERSYQRRGEGAVIRGQTREQNLQNAKRQFDAWPWGKVCISLEQITAAVTLFDNRRADR